MKKNTTRKFLCIDPGDFTGWAFWNRTKLTTGELHFNPKECTKVQEQFDYLWTKFEILLQELTPTLVIIEGTEVYGNNAKSLMAVKRGKHHPIPSLFKLAYLIGGYLNICSDYHIHWEIKTFRDWGGNLSSSAVKAQIHYILKQEFKSQHVYDAVGMGLNQLEKL